MSKYTIADVKHLIPQDLTDSQIAGVEAYLNEGTIPPFDPCMSCEPNYIRKLISVIQTAKDAGYWPPAQEEKVEEPEKVEAPTRKVKASK